MSQNNKIFYDKFYTHNHHESWEEAPGKRVVLDFIQTLSAPTSVLDIGCGSGYFLREIHKLHASLDLLMGIDISAVAIEKAESLYDYSFFSTPIENFEYIKKFDLIVSYGVFEHLEDPGKAITKIKENLSPGGHFALLMPTLGHYRTDRKDEGFYEDLNIPPQLQWHWPRSKWESLFEDNNLSLFDCDLVSQFGAQKCANFYFGTNR